KVWKLLPSEVFVDDVAPGVDPQFLKESMHVRVDRRGTDAQRRSDLFVRLPFKQATEYFLLSPGQPVLRIEMAKLPDHVHEVRQDRLAERKIPLQYIVQRCQDFGG